MAIKQINVTQLKHACLDPIWRINWINGNNPSTKSFAHTGTVPVYGTKFHKLVDRFVDWLISKSPSEMKSADEIVLWNELYERFAVKEINSLLESGKIESAHHFSQCLKAFCRRLIQLRERTPKFQSWQDIFLTKEYSLNNIQFRVGSSSIFVSGEIDAVRTHPTYGLEIVDYKLSHGANMKHDLLQIAIYAKMLSIYRPGLRFHGTIEYYEPELQEVNADFSNIENIFQELVNPVLYELTGELKPVSPNNSTAENLIKNPKPSETKIFETSTPVVTSEDLSVRIKECFASFKLKVEILGKQEAPQIIRYKVKPDLGVKVVSLASRAEDLQVFLSLKQPPLIEPAQGCVTIDIPKENSDTVHWREVVKDAAYAENKSLVSFIVGVSIDKRVIIADFSDPNMCHALVAGSAGSGKSEFLKSMVASLISKNTPQTLKLMIIDPKILTFGAFTDCPYLTSPIITDVLSAIPCLEEAVAEMENRYRQLGEERYENLSERFRSGKTDIPFYVIIFDEFADLILAGKEQKKDFEILVSRLAAKGRAAGIHLVLTTQRPDKNVVAGLIKCNLPLKICLRVTTSTNSQIIIDQSGGESLLGKGDLLCDRGKGIERAQSPYISQDELLQIAKK